MQSKHTLVAGDGNVILSIFSVRGRVGEDLSFARKVLITKMQEEFLENEPRIRTLCEADV